MIEIKDNITLKTQIKAIHETKQKRIQNKQIEIKTIRSNQ